MTADCINEKKQVWQLKECRRLRAVALLAVLGGRYKTECANGAAGYDPDFIDFDKINSRLATKAP